MLVWLIPRLFQSRKRAHPTLSILPALPAVPARENTRCIHGDGLPPLSPLPSLEPPSPSASTNQSLTPSTFPITPSTVPDNLQDPFDDDHPHAPMHDAMEVDAREQPEQGVPESSTAAQARSTLYELPVTRGQRRMLNTRVLHSHRAPEQSSLCTLAAPYSHKPPAQRRIPLPAPVLPPLKVIQNMKGKDYVRPCRHTCVNCCKATGYCDGKSASYHTHCVAAQLHLTCTPVCPMFSFLDNPEVLNIHTSSAITPLVPASQVHVSSPTEILPDHPTTLPPITRICAPPQGARLLRILFVLDPSNKRRSARATTNKTAWYKIDVPIEVSAKLLIPPYRGYVFNVTAPKARGGPIVTLAIMEMVCTLPHITLLSQLMFHRLM